MRQAVVLDLPPVLYPNSRILVIDDEPASVELLTSVLGRAGYRNVAPLTEPDFASEAISGFEPDLVIMSPSAPGPEGMRALSRLGPACLEDHPVLIVSSLPSIETKRAALALGASEYMMRPFEAIEFLVKVGNLINVRRRLRKAQRVSAQLADRLGEVQLQAEQAQIEMLARIARIIDHSDDTLSQHTWRVAKMSGDVAAEMGLPQDTIDNIRRAARLHDLGKVVVSDRVLGRAGPLNEDETALIRAHPSVGALVLSGGTSPLVQMAERIALSHHERWDGSGYPNGLAGEEIPIEARIVAVCDAFDAMTNDRPYRTALSDDEGLQELRAGAGTQFDPQVVDAFIRRQAFASSITEA